ncbi:MAG: amidophosphoribosyltransferase [Patescibacteria group bacterium]
MPDLGEKCGVFGIYGKHNDASRTTFFGLYALQHRGQESSGIASTDGERVFVHKSMGLVPQVFDEAHMELLKGHSAVGHNRYTTFGSSGIEQAHPIVIEDVGLSLVHNGNIPVTKKLESFLASNQIDTKTLSDSQMIAEAVAVPMRQGRTLPEALQEVFPLITGAFSLLLMDKQQLVAVRDSHGIRPLSMGKTDDGAVVFASETCAFHPTGITYVRDILPGEMVVADKNGTRSVQIQSGKEQLDIFEFVYFSRPDSVLLGKSVYEVRKNFGIELAKEFVSTADVVIPVPETSIPVAIGYAKASGIPFEMGLIKNRYIHRTFIQPQQNTREQSAKMKLTPIPEVIRNKHIIIVDDSIVRGTTSRTLISMLYGAGAKKITMLISSPPVAYPDFYGIDTPKQKDLLAYQEKSVEGMRTFLGVDELYFLSYAGLIRSTGLPESSFCTSCFTGNYPIDIGELSNTVHTLPHWKPKT